jgi:hypothetical protein
MAAPSSIGDIGEDGPKLCKLGAKGPADLGLSLAGGNRERVAYNTG